MENVAYSPESVAEHTLMLILMSLRNMKNTEKKMEAYDYRLPQKRFKELKDLKQLVKNIKEREEMIYA